MFTYAKIEHYEDEKEFFLRVEKDAIDFKPLGDKIYSYQRSVATRKGKGKASESTETLDEDSNDVVVYEAYHVRLLSSLLHLFY